MVWAVWAVMTALLAALFAMDATNVPLAEDWLIVPAFTGNETDFGGWLWSQNNEHRVPWPRLVMLAILYVTGGSFQAIGWFNLALQATVAAGLIVLARKLRGRADVADAFFPLLLLHWGHSVLFLFSFLNSLVLPIAATLLLGGMLMRPESLRNPLSAAIVGVALLTLPLCGFVGLLFVPGFALALALVVWCQRSDAVEVGRQARWILVGAVAITLGVSAWYFVGYETPWWNPPSPGWRASLRTALRVMSMGFGVAPADQWRPFIAAALLLIAGTACCLGLAVRRAARPERRALATFGLFWVSAIVFAFAVGWARSGWERQFGIPTRYAVFVVPTFVGCFVAWVRWGRGWPGIWIPRALALTMLLLLPWNTRGGNLRFADWYRVGMANFHRDVAAGEGVDALAAKHGPFLYHAMKPPEIATRMRMLHEAGVSPFDQVAGE